MKTYGPGIPGPFLVWWRKRSMTRRLILAALTCALVSGMNAAQADAQSGRAKARMCAVCHGEFGISVLPNAPSLAGQPEIYLAEQLKAYRSGKRSDETMSVVAKALSDADIADLATWFASIAIEAKPPK
jgi:cytochrome c553